MSTQQFESIWDAIEDSPGEAEEMKRRAGLMLMLADYVKQRRLSTTQAAKMFGVNEHLISQLIKGKISQFDLDALEGMAVVAGLAAPESAK